MRRTTILLVAFSLIGVRGLAAQEHHHELSAEEIGSVHFSTSCSKGAQPGFNRAVALLHSFQYEQARQAFNEVAALDSSCAMAQWGVAMSHYHGLWDNGDIAAGRLALKQAQEIAAAKSATAAREKAYIEALAAYYREDGNDTAAHSHEFEQKMGEVQAAYPDDSEAAIFHALSLSITAPKTDKTFANQRRCGEILEPIFKKQPHHPGVAHYIIHCYDNPVLAEKGLTAARMYAKIAPASAHANHMPSHLFTRVGSWKESSTSNLRAAQLAAVAEPASSNGEARDQRLHAMDYLEYAYLQSGQIKQAKAVLAEMNALPPVSGLTLTGDLCRGRRRSLGPPSEKVVRGPEIWAAPQRPNINWPHSAMWLRSKTMSTGRIRLKCSVAKWPPGSRNRLARRVMPSPKCAPPLNSRRAWTRAP